MRSARRAVCDDRPGAVALVRCSVVYTQADYSNPLIDRRPPETALPSPNAARRKHVSRGPRRVRLSPPIQLQGQSPQKKAIGCVCDARDDANRTLSVEYKLSALFLPSGLVNVSFAWGINGEAFTGAILVGRGGRCAYTHAHLLDR